MQFALQVFEYEDHHEFRTFDIQGDPWFVLADVCRALGIKNTSDAASRLDDDEKGIAQTDTLGGKQNVLIINESGLYSLTLRSDRPEAKRFKRWVTFEVLPQIRRTGAYAMRGRTPAFIRRYNHNWNRVSPGHFSVLSECVIRLWGRLEQLGHLMADRSEDGTELRPDVSVGRLFSGWLKKHHPHVADEFTFYMHWTPQGEFEVRQYVNSMWPLFADFLDSIWVPQHAERYFKNRDPAALPHLPRLLPTQKPVKSRPPLLAQALARGWSGAGSPPGLQPAEGPERPVRRGF